MSVLIPWIILHGQFKHILDDIYKQWDILLNGKEVTEEKYHEFIANHAGLMLSDGDHKLIAASKIHLGSDLAVDFAVTNDRASYGFSYELIEIELPHSPPYNKKGNPSERLFTAIQQIQKWQLWLKSNPAEAQRLFPSKEHRLTGNPSITYTVIIGRRDNTKKFLQLRNYLANSLKIQIRSFDYLTDSLLTRKVHVIPIICSTEMSHVSISDKNALSNPFFKAFTDKEWKSIVKNNDFEIDHMIANNVKVILTTRKYNEYLTKFMNEWDALDEKERHQIIETTKRYFRFAD